MATNTSDIRNGLVIELNNDLWSVVEFQHVKPGKGPAFVRTKLKSLTSGKVVDNTIPAGHKIYDVRVERRKFQFLYKDDNGFNFMNNETYEQISLQGDTITGSQFLKDGENVEILVRADDSTVLTCDVPNQVVLKVTYTEPGLRGDTATNVTKPATVETGATVNVPIFINEGEHIKVDTKNGSYMERVKV